MPNGWGVHFWMITPRTLFVRFTRRRGRRFTAAVVSRRVTPGRWQFVGASYNGRTGIAKLFVNRKITARKYIGRIRLATNYPVRMGARIGDGRYFRGRISCMQVYNGALSLRQIVSKKRRCFRRSKWWLRWLKAVSSTFQDVDFDVSLLPLVINGCYNHGIKKLPNHWWTRWYNFRDPIGYHSNTMTS